MISNPNFERDYDRNWRPHARPYYKCQRTPTAPRDAPHHVQSPVARHTTGQRPSVQLLTTLGDGRRAVAKSGTKGRKKAAGGSAIVFLRFFFQFSYNKVLKKRKEDWCTKPARHKCDGNAFSHFLIEHRFAMDS